MINWIPIAKDVEDIEIVNTNHSLRPRHSPKSGQVLVGFSALCGKMISPAN